MSDTVRVTEVLKKKLSSVPEVEEGDLTIEDMLIGLKSDDNKKDSADTSICSFKSY